MWDFEMAVFTVVGDVVPSSVRDVGSVGARAFTGLPKDSQLERQEEADVHELVDEYRSTECTRRMIDMERHESLCSRARRLGIEDRGDDGFDVTNSAFKSGALEFNLFWYSNPVTKGAVETSLSKAVVDLASTVEPSKSNEDGLTSWLSDESSYAWVCLEPP